MKKLILALVLSATGACASDVLTEHDIAVDEEAFTEGMIDVVVKSDGKTTMQDSCPQTSALSRTTSKACPDCPLIWVYAVNSPTAVDDLQYAGDFWNRALGRKVVGVDAYHTSTRTNENTVPRFGVVALYNNTYTPLADNVAGQNTQGTGNNCRRDHIKLNFQSRWTQPGRDLTRVTWAHEIGHTLLNFSDHSTDPQNLMFHAAAHWNLSQGELDLIRGKLAVAKLF